MAVINVDDIYILDETGAQVDQVTGLYFKNENASDTEKAQARANIGAGGSNRNLLDNAYFVGGGSQLGDGVFPINQRELTSYSSPGINLDRWRNDGELTLYSDGITCGSYLYQAHPQVLTEQLLGKTLTASILLNDGTIISGTGTFPASVPSSMQIVSYNADYELVSILTDTWTQLFRFNGATLGGRHVKAVKLEFGTVSTLANDAPPDFGEELRKCQRYLWVKTFTGNTQLGSGIALTADQAVVSVITPVPMRSVQNITFTVNCLLVGNGQVLTVSAVTGINQYDNIARLVLSSSGLTAYHTYSFFTTTETTMAIYAEP